MFKKWELVEKGKRMIRFSPILGRERSEASVTVDVYRKKKINGIYKYKYVVRENE